MSILQELTATLAALNRSSLGAIPISTGSFRGKPPIEYVVITPMTDLFECFADNLPQYETQEARLSLFSKINYQQRKNQIVQALLDADFTITDRRYIGYEEDTEYFHVVVDVAKVYEIE